MYDARSEPHEFVGATREDAVEKASRFFGASSEQLTVIEIDPGQVSGLAARTLIVAFPEGTTPASPRGGGEGRGREERERRPRRERGGRERGGRGGRPAREAREERGREARAERPPPAEPAEPAEPSKGTAVGEISSVGEFVQGVIERLGLGPFEISETAEGEHRVVMLRGPAAAALTGGDGRAVDALQLVANQASMQADEEGPRVILDVEGDREKRAALLERAAERAAERARSSGRAVALDPMNARDRRAVHVALRDAEGIATMSVGEGRYRQVVVVPEGAPEYEEARRADQEAAERESEG